MQVRSGRGCRRLEQPQPQHLHRLWLHGTFTGRSDRHQRSNQNQKLNRECIWKRTNSPLEMRHAALCSVTYLASAWTWQEREMVNWKTSGGSCPESRREGSSDVQKQRCQGQGSGGEEITISSQSEPSYVKWASS